MNLTRSGAGDAVTGGIGARCSCCCRHPLLVGWKRFGSAREGIGAGRAGPLNAGDDPRSPVGVAALPLEMPRRTGAAAWTLCSRVDVGRRIQGLFARRRDTQAARHAFATARCRWKSRQRNVLASSR